MATRPNQILVASLYQFLTQRGILSKESGSNIRHITDGAQRLARKFLLDELPGQPDLDNVHTWQDGLPSCTSQADLVVAIGHRILGSCENRNALARGAPAVISDIANAVGLTTTGQARIVTNAITTVSALGFTTDEPIVPDLRVQKVGRRPRLADSHEVMLLTGSAPSAKLAEATFWSRVTQKGWIGEPADDTERRAVITTMSSWCDDAARRCVQPKGKIDIPDLSTFWQQMSESLERYGSNTAEFGTVIGARKSLIDAIENGLHEATLQQQRGDATHLRRTSFFG